MKSYIHTDAEVSNYNHLRNSGTHSRYGLIILQQPSDVTTSIGTYISLRSFVYSQNPSFQWYNELGKPIPNGNEKDLFIGPVKREDFGFYKLEIIDQVTGERKHTRWTEVRNLKNGLNKFDYSKPKLAVSPEGGNYKRGTTVHLFGAFDNALEYQWYRDGEMIQGCRGNNLVITDCVSENSGKYVLLAGNLGGIERTEEVAISIK